MASMGIPFHPQDFIQVKKACGHFITLRVIQQFSKTQTSLIRVFFLENILVAMILRCSHGHVTEERHTFGRGTGHEPRNYGIGRVDRHPNVTRSGT